MPPKKRKAVKTVKRPPAKKPINSSKDILYKELVRKNKDLEQFAYIISHNLRSPVANIKGLFNVLKTPKLDSETYAKCMKGLEASAERLDEIIMDLSHILEAKSDLSKKKERVRLSEITKLISEDVNTLIKREKAQIKTDLSVDEIVTVKSYIQSIFLNLISNSIKYRHPDKPPVINISSKKRNRKLILEFKDNGSGFDLKQNRDKIFNLYKRFHDNVEGKGVGLFMVKTQVEMLGGKVSVDSRVGKGTTFRIEFKL